MSADINIDALGSWSHDDLKWTFWDVCW